MGQKYLGETFDIHGGGIENVFPHHEDEIAQAEAATGKPFVKYWLHNNMVTVGGQKMGKSLGNFITLKDAFQKWDPMVLRLFILQSHYRSPTDFSDQALNAVAQGACFRLARAFEWLAKVARVRWAGKADPNIVQFVQGLQKRFHEAMDDDFGTAGAVAVLSEFVREVNRIRDEGSADAPTLWLLREAFEEMTCKVLGFSFEELRPGTALSLTVDMVNRYKAVPDDIMGLFIEMRADARAAKNFAQADAIRKRLDEIGIILEDTKEGTKWRFK
jgi:cysteinyl-tRNA synthetase